MPQVLRTRPPTRWRVTYIVTGQTSRALASYARITLQHGATRWRFRSARVTQKGATTWQYVAPVPRWFPSGTATLTAEVHLTVRGQVEELQHAQIRHSRALTAAGRRAGVGFTLPGEGHWRTPRTRARS